MKAIRHKIGRRMSQAVRAGDMVCLAGQIPDDRTADIVGQTAQTLAKIDALLTEIGGTKSDLVSVQIWLSDMTDFAGMNTAWEAWVDPENPPARATAGVALASPGVRVEIIGVAFIPS
ncbi:RidA family protein [Seohaeicola saemankumensis]|uniref:RidA family protein n=1 Tax=Seohaeicola TaxID=481178 RepID=UPI0035D0C25D